MPGYYERSHIDSRLAERTREDLRLKEGDVLVWNGGTGFENKGEGGESFMLMKHS